MSKEASQQTLNLFSTFRTKCGNLALQSLENANLRYRKNKHKKEYIEWRCFQDKSHKCKAKFFTSITLKKCWNLQEAHTCGSDLILRKDDDAADQELKIEVQKKAPPCEKPTTLLGIRPRKINALHLPSQKSDTIQIRIRKHEQKHLDKQEKEPQRSRMVQVIQAQGDMNENTQEKRKKICAVDEIYCKKANANEVKGMTQQSIGKDLPCLPSLIPQSFNRVERDHDVLLRTKPERQENVPIRFQFQSHSPQIESNMRKFDESRNYLRQVRTQQASSQNDIILKQPMTSSDAETLLKNDEKGQSNVLPKKQEQLGTSDINKDLFAQLIQTFQNFCQSVDLAKYGQMKQFNSSQMIINHLQ